MADFLVFSIFLPGKGRANTGITYSWTPVYVHRFIQFSQALRPGELHPHFTSVFTSIGFQLNTVFRSQFSGSTIRLVDAAYMVFWAFQEMNLFP